MAKRPFAWDDRAYKSKQNLVALGLPAPKARQTFRAYFRALSVDKPEGWMAKIVQFTGLKSNTIHSAIRREARKTSRKKPEESPTPGFTSAELLHLTSPEEAYEFVGSDPDITEQFVKWVVAKRRVGKKR